MQLEHGVAFSEPKDFGFSQVAMGYCVPATDQTQAKPKSKQQRGARFFRTDIYKH